MISSSKSFSCFFVSDFFSPIVLGFSAFVNSAFPNSWATATDIESALELMISGDEALTGMDVFPDVFIGHHCVQKIACV